MLVLSSRVNVCARIVARTIIACNAVAIAAAALSLSPLLCKKERSGEGGKASGGGGGGGVSSFKFSFLFLNSPVDVESLLISQVPVRLPDADWFSGPPFAARTFSSRVHLRAHPPIGSIKESKKAQGTSCE